MTLQTAYPEECIRDVEELEEMLSRPSARVVETMGRLAGDLIVLGVGGKIGPSLAAMARRASDAAGVRRRIVGVSRFSDPALREALERQGIETLACDLLEPGAVDRLPAMPNVLYLAVMKFGASGQAPATWAMNSYLPGRVAERYRDARIVAYSTGNVYPLVPPAGGGSREDDAPAPQGDYAMSCVGRERVFQYFSQQHGTPTALVRLNYAHEMRYGVMVDLALQILAGRPIDLTMGYFNAIWQGDSNAMTLHAFDHLASPAWIVNVAGPETLSVREVAASLAERLDRPVTFTGSESADAVLSNSQRAGSLFGPPRVPVARLLDWIADWHRRGGPTLGKPTKFQVRDGKF